MTTRLAVYIVLSTLYAVENFTLSSLFIIYSSFTNPEISILLCAVLPVILDKRHWVDLRADAAIKRKLVDMKQEPVDWPKNAPGMFARQLSPQYKFRARLQGSDIGFKIVSLFTGMANSIYFNES